MLGSAVSTAMDSAPDPAFKEGLGNCFHRSNCQVLGTKRQNLWFPRESEFRGEEMSIELIFLAFLRSPACKK